MRSPNFIPRIFKLGVIAAFVFACSEPTAPRNGALGGLPPSAYAISDAMHADGNQHVFFLPPMVAAPSKTNGPFDPAVAAEVDICELTSAGCLTPFIAQFTRTTGPGSETIRVDGDKYIVNWHTDRFPISANKIYRVRLRVLATVLGFADVQVFSNASQAKNAVTGETFALVDGRTLPIKFRIEEGAVFVFPTSGGVARTADGKVEMAVPAGAIKEPVALTIAPAAPQVLDELLLSGGVYEFGPTGTQFDIPIKVTLKFNTADIPFGSAEENVRLHMIANGVDGQPYWAEVEGSAVDLVNHTVSGLVPHFSQASARARTPVASIRLSTIPAAVTGRQAFTYYAYPLDSKGNVLGNRVVTGASSAPGTLAANTFTYLPPTPADPNCTGGCYRSSTQAADVSTSAAATITVTSEVATTSFTRTVDPVAIKTVTITPSPAAGPLTMRMYETSTLSVSLVDVAGLPVTNRQLTWSGVRIAKLTSADAKGYTTNVEALDRGTATLTLSIEGSTMTATEDLKITSPPVAKVTISPGDATLPYGDVTVGTKVFDVKGLDIPDAAFSWTLSDPAVAELSVDNDRTVRFARVLPLVSEGGKTTVTVGSEGVSASMALTFLPAPVASIRVDAVPSTLTGRQVVNYTVYPMSANGTILRNRAVTAVSTAPSVLGTSVLTYVAPIAGDPACANGCYRGLLQAADVPEAAPASITVASEGVSTTISTNVNPVALRSVTIAPMPATGPLALRMYETRDLSVSIIDVEGLPVTNRRLTWSGGAPTVSLTPTDANGYSAMLAALARGTATVGLLVQGSSMTVSVSAQVSSPPAVRLALTPGDQTVPFGSADFTIKAYDVKDLEIPDASIAWSVLDESVASLESASGGAARFMANAHDGASTTVSAMADGLTAAAALAFLPEPVTSFRIVDASLAVFETGTLEIHTVVAGPSGVPLLNRPISWVTADPEVAQASWNSGRSFFIGNVPGTTTLQGAVVEGIAASVPVTVLPYSIDRIEIDPSLSQIELGQQAQLTALLFSSGMPIHSKRNVIWLSDKNVEVDASAGLVRAVHMGWAHVYATVQNEGGATATTSITISVTAPPLSGVSIDPEAPTLVIGETVDMAIVGRDFNGQGVAGLDFNYGLDPDSPFEAKWLATAPGDVVHHLSVKAVRAGDGLLRAGVPGTRNTGLAWIHVVSPVDHIVLTPSTTEILVGEKISLRAVAVDASGVVLADPVKLRSSNEAIALIDALSGDVKGIAQGVADIIATAGDVSTVFPISVVTAFKVGSVEVIGSSRVTDTESKQFTAVVRSVGGRVLTDRKVAWSNNNSNIWIQPTGLFYGTGWPGTTIVTATSEGVSGTASLEVTPTPVATIVANVPGLILTRGETNHFDISLYSSNGRFLYNRDIIWTSSRPDLVTVAIGDPRYTFFASVTASNLTGRETAVIRATIEGQTFDVTEVALVPTSGNIVLDGDAATLSDEGFAQAGGTARYAQNILALFSGGTLGRFLVCAPPSVNWTRLTQEIVASGHLGESGCGGSLTPDELATSYSAFFVVGKGISRELLRSYVTAGGNAYIAGGSGEFASAAAEGTYWNDFVFRTGMRLYAGYGRAGKRVSNISTRAGNTRATSLVSGVGSLLLNDDSYAGPNWDLGTHSTKVSYYAADGFPYVSATYDGGAPRVAAIPHPTALEVSTSTPSITYTQSAQFTAAAKFGTASLPATSVEWSTSDPNVATVDANGLVTGHSLGPVTITGWSQGVSASHELEVTVRWNMSTTEYATNTQTLYEAQYLQSKNGQYWLVMQSDCNLVLYHGPAGDWGSSTAVWGSGTNGRNIRFFSFYRVENRPCMAVVQGDGNFVIYWSYTPSSSNAIWAGGTHGSGNYHVAVEDDGRWGLWRGTDPYSRSDHYFSFPF